MNLPPQFEEYMSYCMNLQFEEEPNYDYLERLVMDIAKEKNFLLTDNIFDWATQQLCKELDLKYTQLKRQEKLIIKHELTPEQEHLVAEFQFKNFKHVHDIMKTYYDSRCS